MNVGYCGMSSGKRYRETFTLSVSIGFEAMVGAESVVPFEGMYAGALRDLMARSLYWKDVYDNPKPNSYSGVMV